MQAIGDTYKTILVTGGSSGIGRAVCNALTKRGCKVYGTSRKAKHGDQLDNFTLVQLDVTDTASIDSAFEYILANEGRLDAVVNNAGLGMVGPLEHTTLKQVRTLFEANVFGLLGICKVAMTQMRKQGYGKIINISSLGGKMGLPYRGVYSSTKFAVEGLSESLSLEARQFGVTVVLIEPGDFRTGINNNREMVDVPADSPYNPEFDFMHQKINEDVSNALDPLLIGNLVWKILNKRKPKLRYTIASSTQKLALLLKRFVSGRYYERLISRHYKLPNKPEQ